MKEATLCFLVKGNPIAEVLLGWKKQGFGQGKYNGFGGKIEANETVEQAAVRELQEETGLRVSESQLWRAGHLTFLFPARPEWNVVAHVFLARSWEGQPVESDEMKPIWFKRDEIPFDCMWQDDVHWLPLVMAGSRVQATFTFKDDNESVDDMHIVSGHEL